MNKTTLTFIAKIKPSLFLLLLTPLIAVGQPSKGYKIEKDIPYRNDVRRADPHTDKFTRLDIYYPAEAAAAPVIVWFHGGGLNGGSRHIPDELCEKGFIVVGAGYRLLPNAAPDEIIDDAAAAVAWVFSNIERYGGDTSKVYVAGYSAGGYLTAMLAYDKSRLAKWGVDADRIAAAFPLSGTMLSHFNVVEALGQPGKIMIDRYSPLYHLRADAPPTILVTGGRDLDMVGRYEENAYMHRMLRSKGRTDARLYELEGFDHGTAYHPALLLMLKYLQ